MFELGIKAAEDRVRSTRPVLDAPSAPRRRKSKHMALGVPPMRPPSRVPSETSEEEKKQNETHGAPDTDVASGDESGLMPQRGSNRMKTASMSVKEMQRIADRNRRKRDTGIRSDGTPPGGNQSGIDPGNDDTLYRRYGKADAMVDLGFPQNLVTPGTPGQGTGEMNTPFDKLSFELGIDAGMEKAAAGKNLLMRSLIPGTLAGAAAGGVTGAAATPKGKKRKGAISGATTGALVGGVAGVGRTGATRSAIAGGIGGAIDAALVSKLMREREKRRELERRLRRRRS